MTKKELIKSFKKNYEGSPFAMLADLRATLLFGEVRPEHIKDKRIRDEMKKAFDRDKVKRK